MSAVNAFDWKAYTDEERAKHGDPFAEIHRKAKLSRSVSKGMDKVREKHPTHGTIFGITEKSISTKAPEMMRRK